MCWETSGIRSQISGGPELQGTVNHQTWMLGNKHWSSMWVAHTFINHWAISPAPPKDSHLLNPTVDQCAVLRTDVKNSCVIFLFARFCLPFDVKPCWVALAILDLHATLFPLAWDCLCTTVPGLGIPLLFPPMIILKNFLKLQQSNKGIDTNEILSFYHIFPSNQLWWFETETPLCYLGWPSTHSVTYVSFELVTILLLQSLNCWNYRCCAHLCWYICQ